MKKYGISRRIDNLGRIVIPIEIRRNLNIRIGEELAIEIANNKIILTKISNIDNYLSFLTELCNIIKEIYNFKIIITNREKVIITSEEQNLINKNLTLEELSLIDECNKYTSKKEEKIKFTGKTLTGFFYIFPIITTQNCNGLVLINSNKIDNLVQIGLFLEKLINFRIEINY